jgi:ABC-type Na+ efflux pump permease subunit
VIPLLRHEIRKITRDPSFFFLFTIQIFVLFSGIYASSLYSSFYDVDSLSQSRNLRNRVLRIGVVSSENNNTVIWELSETPKVDVYRFNSFDDSITAYSSGDIDAILVLPEFVSLYEEEDVQLIFTLVLEKGSIESSYIVSFVKDAFERAKESIQKEREETIFGDIFERADFSGGEGSPYTADSAYLFLIPFILIFPGVSVGALLLDNLIEEEKEGTLEQLLLAPLPRSRIFLSKSLPFVVIAATETLIGLIALSLFVEIENIWFLILISLFVSLINSAAALMAQMLGKTRQDKQAVYTAISFPEALIFSPLLPQPVYSISSGVLRPEAVFYLIIPLSAVFLVYLSLRLFRKN